MTNMRKVVCLFAVLLMILTTLVSPYALATGGATVNKTTNRNTRISSMSEYGAGYRYNIQGWIYVYIEGEPYERGFQHGYLLSEEIVDLMTRWSNMINNHPCLKPFNGLLSKEKYEKTSDTWWNFCKKQIVNMYWDKYPDEYKEEIRGIADGVYSSGIKFHDRDINYEDILTSNMMYEYLSKLTGHSLRKGFHPLATLLKNLKEEAPELATIKLNEFTSDFIDQPMHHKCNGFIATGDATTKGQIVISNSMWSTGDGIGMWWWSYYITFRWNLVLDINPTTGNRVIMTAAPGYIWSDHDFYQNDNGIVFLETTNPQGLWDNKGLPLAIRARLAAQYSNNIDDVMNYLKYRNDGCMNAVWLIGDTKTGEIARFELGYRHSWYNKTFNGFHWSANNPMDFKVRLEKLHLRDIITDGLRHFLFEKGGRAYSFPRYRPSNRDRKFEELGNLYYGEIDVDIVKKIMSTEPLSPWSPDCKITDSDLVEKNGLWIIIGNPDNRILDVENLDDPKIKVESIPPAGWVRIYGLPEKNGYETPSAFQELGNPPQFHWTYETEDNSNTFYSSNIVKNDILYSTTSTGEILAINIDNAALLWNLSIGKNPTAPAIHDDKIFIGTTEGLEVIDLNWMMKGTEPLGKILSPPVAIGNTLIVGNENGNLYALDTETGGFTWNLNLPNEIYTSNPWDHYLFIGSGDKCYKINIENGDISWIFETDGMITSRPYVQDDVMYFGSWDTFVYAVNAETGNLKWKFETGWGVETTPIVDDGLVFVGSHDNNFYALHKNNGTMCWAFTCKSGIHSSPAVSDNYVIFGSDDGRLYCLDKLNGNLIWNFSPGYTIDDKINYLTTPIISDPIVDGETVFMGANGNIYALSI